MLSDDKGGKKVTIRKLLLILFLYVLLVWIVAAYLYSGDLNALVKFGLLWTAVGIALLLCGVLLERVFVWRRSRQVQQAATPAKPAAAGPAILSEDDVALLGLIKEADQRLAQAPGDGRARPPAALDLPLFLAIGPEGSGKTAAIRNSGLEPALLAGQAIGNSGSIAPTRVANLWLAHESLLLDVSGRIFSGERLTEFLRNLRPSKAQGWKSWLLPEARGSQLRGVLLFFNAREFLGTPEPSRLDRWAQAIRTRLTAIAQVFGAECPVYVLFTNADALPYFEDFFNSLPEAEAGQVLGVITEGGDSQSQGRVWAEAETKRLNQFFQALFLRLSNRRITALGQEIDPVRKPSVYEFPREFRKMRGPLVQFLVDTFKPDPLSPEPPLRGFFFVGTRKVEQTAGPAAGATQVYQAPGGAAPGATQIFAPGGMTQVFRSKPKGGAPLVERWMFAAEFFQNVLTLDRPVVRAISTRANPGKQRQLIAAVAAGLAALLALIWTVSWIGNWSLVSDVQAAVSSAQSGNADLSVANLNALDRLRVQLTELQDSSQWHLHWGLYTGNDLLTYASRAYFSRLKQLSLDRLNQTIGAELRQTGSAGQSDDASAVYDRLKTERTIAAKTCAVDQSLVRRVLTDTVPKAHAGLDDIQRGLLDTQLGFYVTQLAANKNLPVQLGEDGIGVANARAFVRQQSGLDQRLRGMLSEISGQVKPLPVPAEYRSVLSSPTEFSGVFTKQGQLVFEDRVAHDNFGGEEQCVMGDSVGQRVAQQLDTGARDRLRSLYYRQYADAWRDFLMQTRVLRFGGPQDAVEKLTTLSDSRSPLLGIIRMAAENTNFQLPKQGELNWWEKAAQKAGLGGLLQAQASGEKSLSRASQLLSNDAPLMTAADVASLFQPVLITTPPSALLVNDANKEYMDGLRKLTDALAAYARASDADKGAALQNANAAVAQAGAAHTALSDKFPDVGKEGLNKLVSDLLKQPITFAAGLLPANLQQFSGARKNNDFRQVCNAISSTLAKFPFNPDAKLDVDATLAEVGNVFAPTGGKVWEYVQKSGTDLVQLNKSQVWEQKPDLQGMKVDPDLLTFLNRAQDLRKAFFADNGAMQARLQYQLQRVPGQTIGVQLTLDGVTLPPDTSLSKAFYWPASGGAPGAEGTVLFSGGGSVGFGKQRGLWAVFRLFQNADPRALGEQRVVWSTVKGQGGATPQPLNPPAKVDIVAFPGGVDLFNPKFFEDLKCKGRAVILN